MDLKPDKECLRKQQVDYVLLLRFVFFPKTSTVR